jgi:tRNA U34 5-methylaminomethyl-2-thiouridine-forming methyltransferase MnmC
MYKPPADFVPLRTGDGSLTLRSDELGEQYHSLHGAVQESTHVFIKAGLEFIAKDEVDVLEVGLGTGLNLLLTWIRCLEGKCRVRYTALEPFPLRREQLEALGHCADLAWPGLHEPFIQRMTSPEQGWHEAMGGLTFRKLARPVGAYEASEAYDVIYFDAFAPGIQPELWTLDVFQRMHRALRPGGVLVTYCAKGEVRRALIAAGFDAKRHKGPPGKAHMLRAVKSGN